VVVVVAALAAPGPAVSNEPKQSINQL